MARRLSLIFASIFQRQPIVAEPSLMTSDSTEIPIRESSPDQEARLSRRDNFGIDFRLTAEDASIELRKEGFAHLKVLAGRQASSGRRQEYYDVTVIKTHHSIVDLQIDVLETLTDGGRRTEPFEAELIKFLNHKLRQMSSIVEQLREENRGSRPRNSVYDLDKDLSSRAPTGAEKGLLDIFYLIAGIITHQWGAFREAQMSTLLDTVANIAKTTTMHRALRGALKILTVVTIHSRIPDKNLRPSVIALCAILGTATFKFGEEAWTCLYNLASCDENQSLGHVLVNDIVNRYDISNTRNLETRDLAKYSGALLALQRIIESENNHLISSITPNITSLVHGLQRACFLDSDSTQVTARIIYAMLLSDDLVRLLIDEDWLLLRQELDLRDQSLIPQGGTKDVTGTRERMTRSSPFSRFIYADFASIEILAFDQAAKVLGNIGERISFLMNNQWQTLSKSRSLLLTRLLFHIARYNPVIWVPAIQAMWAHELLKPTDENWSPHLGMLIAIVGTYPSKPAPVVESILHVFTRLNPLLQNDNHSSSLQEYDTHLQSLCETLRVSQPLDTCIIKSLTDLMEETTLDVDSKAFEDCLRIMEQASSQLSSSPSAPATTLEIMSECVVRLFLNLYPRSYSATLRLFSLLMDIVSSSRPTKSRLLAMRLLTRLRCNTDYVLKIVHLPASEDLAGNLCRKFASGITSEAAETPLISPSTHGQVGSTRAGRSSAVDSGTLRSRSAVRSLNAKDQWRLVNPPVWMQDGSMDNFSTALPTGSSAAISAQKAGGTDSNILDLEPWMEFMVKTLEGEKDWEVYTHVLVHMPLQLSNYSLFSNQVKLLQILHSTLIIQLNKGNFLEPPTDSGVKKGDIALCLYQVLKMLLPYHENFSRRMAEDTVRTFRLGIEKWDRTGKCCIHALALCCYETPSQIEKQIVSITELMQKRVTQGDLAMDILEFLGCLSRLRQAYGEADAAFYRRIFGICIRYLQVAWEQRQKRSESGKPRTSAQHYRQSGSSVETARTAGSVQSKESQGLSEYVYLLAYQTIIVWFLSIDVRERAQHVGWLTQELSWPDELGKERMEEQSLVVLDMMHRTAFSNFGETKIGHEFIKPSNKIIKKMWLVGMSIVTTEVASDPATGTIIDGQLTKRQASGTTHAIYHHNTGELPRHHVQEDIDQSSAHTQQLLDVYPGHMFLQLASTIAPTPLPLQPIPLPDDEFTKRAIRVFDKIDTVDGHKVGVIYIGEGQETETEILANASGSDGYEAFLTGLGTKVPLKDATFNTQGLDHQDDEDGTHTYAWRDRVTEVVFHVPTLMPTDSVDDPQADKKKRHVGNDHIKLIYNDSGLPFDFDTFATAMNTVNIVITPEAHTSGTKTFTDSPIIHSDAEIVPSEPQTTTERFGFYCVQTLFSQAYPQFSTAAGTQIVSAESLPAFVRQIAITCSVFCQIWETSIIKDSEYISNWRARLQEIIKLRTRFANTNTSANIHYPMSGAEQTLQYSEGSEWTGSVTMGGLADTNRLLTSLDFTRWT